MRNTLFNEEVEGYTYGKYSTIKLIILSLVILAVFMCIGWVLSMLAHTVSVMDTWTDTQLLDELLRK